MIQRLVEISIEAQLEERGGQVVDGMIETSSKGEVSEASWKMIDWLVEYTFELQLFDVGREVVHWLVELDSKREIGKRLRKRRVRVVEHRTLLAGRLEWYTQD